MASKGTNTRYLRNLATAQALMDKRRRLQDARIAVSRNRGAIPAALGIGYERSTTGGSGSGGIKSPVSEPNANLRTYHTNPRLISSTDGVFEIEIRDLDSISMEDADGNFVQFQFAQPS